MKYLLFDFSVIFQFFYLQISKIVLQVNKHQTVLLLQAKYLQSFFSIALCSR